MANTENRYIRIEDWKGNVYYPDTNSKASTAGIVIDSSLASKGATGTNTRTDGDKVSDSKANGGSAIMIASLSERQTLFCTYVANIPFGSISVGARLKSSIAEGTAKLVELNTYFVDASGDTPVETLLDTMYITASMFDQPNEYSNIGYVTDYRGVAAETTFLKIELIVLPDTGATIYFDQLAVAMEKQSGSSVDIHVEDTTIVVEQHSSKTGIYIEGNTIVMKS